MQFHHAGSRPLLSVLRGGPSANQIATGSIAGSHGEVVTQAASVSKFCTRSDGSLVWLAPRTNLCIHSQNNYNAGHGSFSSTTAPDGTNTAGMFTSDGTVNEHRVVWAGGGTVTVGTGTYTVSMYAKAGTAGFISHWASSFVYNIFDLTAGAVVASVGGAVGSITNVGNGWYRCSTTIAQTASSPNIISSFGDTQAHAIPQTNFAGVGLTISIWGQQVEATQPANGLTSPTAYIPTTTTTVTVNPVAVEPNGILVEAAATNTILQSQALATAPWTAGGLVVAAPTVTNNTADVLAPDGTQTATKVVYPQVIGGGAKSAPTQSFVGTAAAWSFSVWLRTVSGTATVYLSATPDGLTYKRVACAVTTTWQRFTLVNQTLTAATWNLQIGVDLRDGSQSTQPAQTVYAWGAQGELGISSTSYIPTTSGTVSRTGDLITVPNPIPSSAKAFGVSAKATSISGDGGTPLGAVKIVASVGNAGVPNTWLFYAFNGALTFRVWDNSGNNLDLNTNVLNLSGFGSNRAFGGDVNGTLAMRVDGSDANTAPNGTGTGLLNSQPATMYIGCWSAGGQYQGWISDFIVCGPSRSAVVGTDPRANIKGVASQYWPIPFGAGWIYTKDGSIKALALGDSITASSTNPVPYPTRLHSRLGDGYAMVNGGVPGDTTAQILTRWTGTYRAQANQFVFLLGGVNDCLTGVATATSWANLKAIIDQCIADGHKPVVGTVMPCFNYGGGGSLAPTLSAIAALNALIVAYGQANPTTMRVVDLHTLMADPNNALALNPAWTSDGLHPNQLGADWLATFMWSSVF